MRHHQNGAGRNLSLQPQIQQVAAQGFRSRHIQGGKRFVHQQHIRIDHQGAGETDPLAHSAGQFLGIGRLKAVQANQIDHRQRPLAPLRHQDTLRLQSQFYVFQHGQPRKQAEGLEHHADARHWPGHWLAPVQDLAGAGRSQAADDPQQRGFAAAGAAQHRDDFAGTQAEVDVVEHHDILMVVGRDKMFADPAQLD